MTVGAHEGDSAEQLAEWKSRRWRYEFGGETPIIVDVTSSVVTLVRDWPFWGLHAQDLLLVVPSEHPPVLHWAYGDVPASCLVPVRRLEDDVAWKIQWLATGLSSRGGREFARVVAAAV